MLTEEMKNIINQIQSTWSKDDIIRYLYMNLAPFFKRDLKYFLATDEEKYFEYSQGFINRGRNIVCSTISDFFVSLYNSIGIKARKVAANSARIPLFAIIVEGNHGWYFIDPLNDLFHVQYNLKTTEYGQIPYYKTLNNNYPHLISLQEDYIAQIDEKLGTIKPLDDFFKIIHIEMTSRNRIAEHFHTPKENRIELFNKKMAFANTHFINLGQVNGPFERLQMYLFLERIMFFKSEKRNIKIYLDTAFSTPRPHIEYENPYTKEIAIFEERRSNNQFILTKTK